MLSIFLVNSEANMVLRRLLSQSVTSGLAGAALRPVLAQR